MGFLAMFVGGGGVLLGFVMLTNGMVMSGLVVVMSGRTVVSGGIVMVFAGRVFALFSHNRSPGWHLDGARVSCWNAICSAPPSSRTGKSRAITSDSPIASDGPKSWRQCPAAAILLHSLLYLYYLLDQLWVHMVRDRDVSGRR
jgi:hypothetical protein